MKAIMNIENLTTIEELERFIQGNQAIAFTVLGDKNQRYQFIQKTLIKFRYITLKKTDKGIVNQYLKKVTGYWLKWTQGMMISVVMPLKSCWSVPTIRLSIQNTKCLPLSLFHIYIT